MMDIATVKIPELLELSGNSLMPFMKNRPKDFKGKHVFSEFEGECWKHPRAMLRDSRYKYVANHNIEERLYDLKNDPYEENNLAKSKKHQSAKNKLKKKYPFKKR